MTSHAHGEIMIASHDRFEHKMNRQMLEDQDDSKGSRWRQPDLDSADEESPCNPLPYLSLCLSATTRDVSGKVASSCPQES